MWPKGHPTLAERLTHSGGGSASLDVPWARPRKTGTCRAPGAWATPAGSAIGP